MLSPEEVLTEAGPDAMESFWVPNAVINSLAGVPWRFSWRLLRPPHSSHPLSSKLPVVCLWIPSVLRRGATSLVISWGGLRSLSAPLHSSTHLMVTEGYSLWISLITGPSKKNRFPTLGACLEMVSTAFWTCSSCWTCWYEASGGCLIPSFRRLAGTSVTSSLDRVTRACSVGRRFTSETCALHCILRTILLAKTRVKFSILRNIDST